MLVADTTAIVHLHLEGKWHAAALIAYQDDPEWFTVPLWRYEFASVLWKIRTTGKCDAEAASETFRMAAERMVPRERAPDDGQALEFALKHRISTYDAYFVTLAQTLKLSLITQDKELLTKFPDTAISLETFGPSSGN